MNRLREKLQVVLEEHTTPYELKVSLPTPRRLHKQLESIENHFEKINHTVPAIEKIKSTIDKMEQNNMVNLTPKDWVRLAWALSLLLPNQPEKTIFTDLGGRILDSFYSSKQSDMSERVYVALLFCYFSVSDLEIKSNHKNWISLRALLTANLQHILEKSRRVKSWMSALLENPDLLQSNPTRKLAMQFMDNSEDSHILKIAEDLRMPVNSWFWDQLILSTAKAICDLDDQAFLNKIETIFFLAEKKPHYKTKLLAMILERYAESKYVDQVHPKLKLEALNQWDNPQYTSSVGWLNVSPKVKQMVNQWFIRADLEAFFRVFGESSDERRFSYWMRFIKQMSFSKILLGSHAAKSSHYKYQDFRKQNKGRFGYLFGTTPLNNAFVMQIGNCFIVEFSEVGPCYMSSRNMLGKKISFDMNELRVGEGHKHLGRWEVNKFDPALRKLGIFPDL
jgi:hypothetical protein